MGQILDDKPNAKAAIRQTILKGAIKRIQGVADRSQGVDKDMLEKALDGLLELDRGIGQDWTYDGYMSEIGLGKDGSK